MSLANSPAEPCADGGAGDEEYAGTSPPYRHAKASTSRSAMDRWSVPTTRSSTVIPEHPIITPSPQEHSDTVSSDPISYTAAEPYVSRRHADVRPSVATPTTIHRVAAAAAVVGSPTTAASTGTTTTAATGRARGGSTGGYRVYQPSALFGAEAAGVAAGTGSLSSSQLLPSSDCTRRPPSTSPNSSSPNVTSAVKAHEEARPQLSQAAKPELPGAAPTEAAIAPSSTSTTASHTGTSSRRTVGGTPALSSSATPQAPLERKDSAESFSGVRRAIASVYPTTASQPSLRSAAAPVTSVAGTESPLARPADDLSLKSPIDIDDPAPSADTPARTASGTAAGHLARSPHDRAAARASQPLRKRSAPPASDAASIEAVAGSSGIPAELLKEEAEAHAEMEPSFTMSSLVAHVAVPGSVQAVLRNSSATREELWVALRTACQQCELLQRRLAKVEGLLSSEDDAAPPTAAEERRRSSGHARSPRKAARSTTRDSAASASPSGTTASRRAAAALASTPAAPSGIPAHPQPSSSSGLASAVTEELRSPVFSDEGRHEDRVMTRRGSTGSQVDAHHPPPSSSGGGTEGTSASMTVVKMPDEATLGHRRKVREAVVKSRTFEPVPSLSSPAQSHPHMPHVEQQLAQPPCGGDELSGGGRAAVPAVTTVDEVRPAVRSSSIGSTAGGGMADRHPLSRRASNVSENASSMRSGGSAGGITLPSIPSASLLCRSHNSGRLITSAAAAAVPAHHSSLSSPVPADGTLRSPSTVNSGGPSPVASHPRRAHGGTVLASLDSAPTGLTADGNLLCNSTAGVTGPAHSDTFITVTAGSGVAPLSVRSVGGGLMTLSGLAELSSYNSSGAAAVAAGSSSARRPPPQGLMMHSTNAGSSGVRDGGSGSPPCPAAAQQSNWLGPSTTNPTTTTSPTNSFITPQNGPLPNIPSSSSPSQKPIPPRSPLRSSAVSGSHGEQQSVRARLHQQQLAEEVYQQQQALHRHSSNKSSLAAPATASCASATTLSNTATPTSTLNNTTKRSSMPAASPAVLDMVRQMAEEDVAVPPANVVGGDDKAALREWRRQAAKMGLRGAPPPAC